MARTFGRVLNSIWDDGDDFVELTGAEQRLYLFLISQYGISHAGLLPITLRRWASKARDLTVEGIHRDLIGLDRARYLIADFDTEEVLVRALIRRDEVYKMPRVFGSAVADAVGVSSRRIRRALLAEVDRLPLMELSDEPTKGRDGRMYPSVRSQVIEHIATLRAAYGPMEEVPLNQPLPEPLREGVGEPAPEGVPGGSGVRAGAQASPSPSPSPIQDPSASATPRAGDGDRKTRRNTAKRTDVEAPEAWARFWKIFPRKKDPDDAVRAWNSAIRRGIDPTDILNGVEFYVLDCRGRDAKYIKYPASWLNAGSWRDEPDPEPQAPRVITGISEAGAMQPRNFAEMRHEFAPRQQSEPDFDFGDAFGIPE